MNVSDYFNGGLMDVSSTKDFNSMTFAQKMGSVRGCSSASGDKVYYNELLDRWFVISKSPIFSDKIVEINPSDSYKYFYTDSDDHQWKGEKFIIPVHLGDREIDYDKHFYTGDLTSHLDKLIKSVAKKIAETHIEYDLGDVNKQIALYNLENRLKPIESLRDRIEKKDFGSLALNEFLREARQTKPYMAHEKFMRMMKKLAADEILLKDKKIEKIPDFLKNLRVARKMTRPQMAEKIGVSKGIIYDYETGKKTPSLKTFLKYLEVFELKIR